MDGHQVQQEISKNKRYLLYLLPLFLLSYFVFGALAGSLTIPGRSGVLRLSGHSAWLACLLPVFWLASELVKHEPWVPFSKVKRGLAAASLWFCGIGAFFYAVWVA